MNTRFFSVSVVLAALAVLAVFAGRASAQSLPLVGGPTAIFAGGYFPSGGDAEHRGGSTQPFVELRYGFPVSVPLTPTRTVIGVGAEFGTQHGDHSTIIPITIAEYYGLNSRSPFSPDNTYLGAGIGPYIENQSGISTSARFGGFVAAGHNFIGGLFVEAKYQLVDHGNGPLVGLGFRF